MKLPQPSSVSSAVNVLMNLSAPSTAETPQKPGATRFEDNLQQQVGTRLPPASKADKTAPSTNNAAAAPGDNSHSDGSSLPPEDQRLPPVSDVEADDNTESATHTAVDSADATETTSELVVVSLQGGPTEPVAPLLPAQPGIQHEVMTLDRTDLDRADLDRTEKVPDKNQLRDADLQTNVAEQVKGSPPAVVGLAGETDSKVVVSANPLLHRQSAAPLSVAFDEIKLATNEQDATEQLTLAVQPKSRPAAEAPNVTVNKSWLENLLAAPVTVDAPGNRPLTLTPVGSAELLTVAESNLSQSLPSPAASSTLASTLYGADQRQLAAAEARQAHTQQLMTNTPSLVEGKTDTLTRAGALQLAFGQAGWGERLGRQLLLQTAQGSSSAQIRLDPPELGSLTVRIQLVDQSAAVNFVSPHAMVRDALEQQSQRLQDMFREQGIDLLDVSVSDQREGNTDNERGDRERHSAGAQTAGTGTQSENSVTVRKSDSLIDYYA